MRLKSISVRNAPPVQLFEVDDLSDVVVLAGPNGVGKTRLIQRIVQHLRGAMANSEIAGIVEATCKEERDTWGKSTLDMSIAEDMTLFMTTLQANRRRRNWKSSLINFESDRSIQALKPLVFTWEMPDPEEEQISWDHTFGFMRDRFQDTVHSMYRMIEVQKQSIANRAIELRRQGHDQMNLAFEDPMKPFREIFSLLLAPKELADLSAQQQRLEYMQDGVKYEFTSLSSGEREVVNIAFDFLLRKPHDCIVFFDEPELHLHPELSYRLIQTLEQIGTNNQFVFSTHSPDIITASLDRSVVFLSSPSKETGEADIKNQAILVTEADATNQALRLLGQSIGIIALGKKIVLIEGTQSSIDKQTYGSIIKNAWPGLVLVASGGKHVIESFSAVYDAVLSRSIWGVEFFMLCDRDTAPISSPESIEAAQQNGRLRVLSRYHLENYFLDEAVWAEAFAPLEPAGSWLRSSDQIRRVLREIAGSFVSYATALSMAMQLRRSVGNVDVMPNDCHGKSADELKTLLAGQSAEERDRIARTLDDESIRAATDAYYASLMRSVSDDSDDWKVTIPGKPILAQFASRAGLNLARAKTMYLNAGLVSERRPFEEILGIFQGFAEA